MAENLTFDNACTTFDPQFSAASANRQALTALMTVLRTEEDSIRLGGGS